MFGELKEYERWKGHTATSRKAAETTYLKSVKKILQVTDMESTWGDASWSSTFLITLAAAAATPLSSVFVYKGVQKLCRDEGISSPSIWLWWWYGMSTIFRSAKALALALARLSFDAVDRRSAYILQELEFRNAEVKKSFRSIEGKPVSGEVIVPGDILCLGRKDEGSKIPFDALVTHGKLSVDEVLFGEERNLVKFGISRLPESAKCLMLSLDWDSAERENHVLRAGSTIERIYGRESTVVVLKTGIATEKGQVVASAFDEKVRMKQSLSDLAETFGVVSIVSIVPIIIWTLAVGTRLNFYYFLAVLITPKFPMLPLVTRDMRLTVVQRSLRRQRISCINKEWILPAGVLNVCCFDKTGTLTTTSHSSTVKLLEYNAGRSGVPKSSITGASDRTKLLVSCCHSLRKDDERDDPKGDSVDASMFKFANAKHLGSSSRDMTEKVLTCDQEEINFKVLKPFNSTAGYMCVVAESLESRYLLLKGSPEEVKSMLISVPKDYEKQANKLAQDYRVIALASKELADNGDPDNKENYASLEFNGFICFQYRVHRSTIKTFDALRDMHDLKILTGDHTLTAIHVAQLLKVVSDKRPVRVLTLSSNGSPVLVTKSQYCSAKTSDRNKTTDYSSAFFKSLAESRGASKKARNKKHGTDGIDELELGEIREILENGRYAVAVTGEALSAVELNYPCLYRTLCNRAVIFGRAKPLQKASIVRTIRESGRGVLMCGDGLNDHPAFKAANVSVTVPSAQKAGKETKDKIESLSSSIEAFLSAGFKKASSTFEIVLKDPRKLLEKKRMYECLEEIAQRFAEDQDVNADAEDGEKSLPIGHFRCGPAGVKDVLKIIEVGRLETAALVYQFNLAVAYYGIGVFFAWTYPDLIRAFWLGSGNAMVNYVFQFLLQFYAAINWFKCPEYGKNVLASPPPDAFVSQRNLAFVFGLTALQMLYGSCVVQVIKINCEVSRNMQAEDFTCEGDCNFAEAAMFVSMIVGTFNVVLGLVPYRHVDPKPIRQLTRVMIIWFTGFFFVRVVLWKGFSFLTEPPISAWLLVLALAATFSAATRGLRESRHTLSGAKVLELLGGPRALRVH